MKQNPRKRKIGLLPKIILTIVVLYTAGVLISLQVQIKDTQGQVDLLTKQVQSQTETNNQLKKDTQTKLDDKLVTDIARNKMGYILPGERIFEDDSQK